MSYEFKNWKEICAEKDRRIIELEEQQQELISMIHGQDERLPRMTMLEYIKSKNDTKD